MMNVNRRIRWCILIACLLAMGLASSRADASPLLGQPGLVQAIAPTTAGWHYRHIGGWGNGGWGGYRGSYYYGRPSIYFGAYRPFYRASSYYYAPQYYGSYGFASPYYANNSFASPYYSTGFYGGYAAYRPIVYSNPVYTTSYIAASPAYVYPTSYPSGYGGGFGGYSGYGGGYASNSYPVYSTYNTYSPYGACYGYW